MTIYQKILPDAFPNVISGPPNKIRHYVQLLTDYDRSDGLTSGSSFAVTVDGFDKYWYLWMSTVSYEYLRHKCNWT